MLPSLPTPSSSTSFPSSLPLPPCAPSSSPPAPSPQPIPSRSLGLHCLSPTSVFLHLSSPAPLPPASPPVRINGRPWPLVIRLQPPSTRPAPLSKPLASLSPPLMLFIYGLEPGTAYTVELDLAQLACAPESESESESESEFEPEPGRRASFAAERPSDGLPHCASRLVAAARALWQIGPRADLNHCLHRRPLPTPKTSRPALPMPTDHDGPPPPYTSHDPASPVAPSSPPASPPRSPVVCVTLPGSPASSDRPPMADSSPGPAPLEEAKMRMRIEEQQRELEEAALEKPRLEAQLAALEQAIRQLDSANAKKADELARLQAHTSTLEQQTARQETQLRKRQAELAGIERRQAKSAGEMEERSRVLRGRWENSLKRVDELKSERLPAIETKMAGLAKLLSELDAQIAAEDLPAAVVWPPLKGPTSCPTTPTRSHRLTCDSTEDFGHKTIMAGTKAQSSERAPPRSHTDPSTPRADQPGASKSALPAPKSSKTIWTNQTQRMTCSLRRGSSVGDKRSLNEGQPITWAKVAGL